MRKQEVGPAFVLQDFTKLVAGLAELAVCVVHWRCVIFRDTQSRVCYCVRGCGRGCFLCTSGFKFLTQPRAIFKALQMCGRE